MRAFLRSRFLPSVVVFLVFIYGFTAANVLTPTKTVSVVERRTLAQRPRLSVDTLVSGQFTRDYGSFMSDQAAFREQLRFLKSFLERKVFRKLENDGVYVVGDFVYDKFYGIDRQRVATAARRMNEIIDDTAPDRVLLAVVPTKAEGLDDPKYLRSDQHEIADALRGEVHAEYVDLMDLPDTDTTTRYYGADPHWTTAGAIAAYRVLARRLGFDPTDDYSFEPYTDAYIGSEYGKAAAWSVPLDTIELAHNGTIDAMTLCRQESADRSVCHDSVYVPAGPTTLDFYDVFLGGLAPLIEITNPRAQGDGHLVVFKDSYAHAIAPFLAQHYRTVTLVDLRYVQRAYVLENVDFDHATILFLYGTSVINTDSRALN